MSNGTLQVPADEQPKPFISNAPSYQWLRSGGWDEDLIVDAEPAVTTKCGRPMSSARASQTVGMMPTPLALNHNAARFRGRTMPF